MKKKERREMNKKVRECDLDDESSEVSGDLRVSEEERMASHPPIRMKPPPAMVYVNNSPIFIIYLRWAFGGNEERLDLDGRKEKNGKI